MGAHFSADTGIAVATGRSHAVATRTHHAQNKIAAVFPPGRWRRRNGGGECQSQETGACERVSRFPPAKHSATKQSAAVGSQRSAQPAIAGDATREFLEHFAVPSEAMPAIET
jgi:hypothetical protein